MINITTVDESINNQGLKLLVYGLLGTGKTVLGSTPASQDSPVLFINAEAGLLSLKDLPEEKKKHISVATVSGIGDIDNVYNLLTTTNDYKWIVLDSISEIAEVVLADQKKSEKDGRAAYGNLADIMNVMLRSFRDIENYNVYMSAKMTRFTDEISNRTMYWPLMPGKQLTNGIGYLFDEVFALRVESDSEGNQTRWLQTQRDMQYECKDRSGKLEMFEPPDLDHIENKINSNNTKIEDDNKNGTTTTE
jgi:hypothetical protein